MVQFVGYQVHHISKEANLQVDYNTLLSAFSILDESGMCINPDNWELHPGSTSLSSEFSIARSNVEK